jgi:hypothetical protein
LNPAQGAWDNAITAFENGQILTGIADLGIYAGEEVMTVAMYAEMASESVANGIGQAFTSVASRDFSVTIGDLVSTNVRSFMNGDIPLSSLTQQEIDDAIQGYERAMDIATTDAQRTYQQARINALLGQGSPPGTLSQFMQNYGMR